jgi:hypothetical protein
MDCFEEETLLSPLGTFSAHSELLMKSEVTRRKKGDSEKQLNFVTLHLAQPY